MRGDWFWPTVIWALVAGVLCWWSPPFGRHGADHIPRVSKMVPGATVKDSLTVPATDQQRLHVRRDTRTINPPAPYVPEKNQKWG